MRRTIEEWPVRIKNYRNPTIFSSWCCRDESNSFQNSRKRSKQPRATVEASRCKIEGEHQPPQIWDFLGNLEIWHLSDKAAPLHSLQIIRLVRPFIYTSSDHCFHCSTSTLPIMSLSFYFCSRRIPKPFRTQREKEKSKWLSQNERCRTPWDHKTISDAVAIIEQKK